MPELSIEFAEAYELLVSLYAYAHTKEHKSLDIGLEWSGRVRAEVGEDFTADLHASSYATSAWLLEILAWRCPGERSAADFLQWLGSLSVGELYEQVAPYASERTRALPPDIGRVRDENLALLHRWHESYFKKLDPAILAGLRQDAAQKKMLAESAPVREVVEAATEGIVLAPSIAAQNIVLVPQYHYRPWNITSNLRGTKLIFYPATAVPEHAGEPPTALRRLTAALNDDSRLRIMHYLAAGEQHTFTEIVRHTGLAKSTVHEHVTLLRAAGLVRVYEGEDGSVSYSFRDETLDTLTDRLRAYFSSARHTEAI